MTPAIRRLLVPVDFSAGSNKAVEYAVVLATALRAAVHLLHVIEETFAAEAPGESAAATGPSPRERAAAETQASVAAIAARFSGTGGRVTTEVRSGRAARQIVGVALNRGADLIVMGTHGRTGLYQVMYVSVAQYVLRKAPCPVLAVCEPGLDYTPASAGGSAARAS